MFPPTAVTVLLPPARSLENETFGYGIGTGPGGVLHTLGRVAVVTPLLAMRHTETICFYGDRHLFPLFPQSRRDDAYQHRPAAVTQRL